MRGMCLGKKDKSANTTVEAPKTRVDPVSPIGADMLRDPLAALDRITGVHTSARGDGRDANTGSVQVNGPGTARPFISPYPYSPKGNNGKPGGPTTTTPTPEAPVAADPERPNTRPRTGGGEPGGTPRPTLSPFGGIFQIIAMANAQRQIKKPGKV